MILDVSNKYKKKHDINSLQSNRPDSIKNQEQNALTPQLRFWIKSPKHKRGELIHIHITNCRSDSVNTVKKKPSKYLQKLHTLCSLYSYVLAKI